MPPFDPSSATLVNQPNQGKGNQPFDPSSAQLVSSPQQTQQQADEQSLSPVSTQSPTSSIDPMSGMGAKGLQIRATTGLMRTAQGKVDAINKIAPELNPQLTPDGKLMVNGKPYDLSPENIGSFIYDLPGMMAEATAKNIPLAANLAVTAMSGGSSIPAQMAMQGAAMGAGEWVKELLAQGLAQEKPSGGDVAMATGFGALGPVGDLGIMATAKGLRSVASSIGNFTGAAKEVGPELLNAMSGIKIGVGNLSRSYLSCPVRPSYFAFQGYEQIQAGTLMKRFILTVLGH